MVHDGKIKQYLLNVLYKQVLNPLIKTVINNALLSYLKV